MSVIYGNWERLVRATLLREELRSTALRTFSDRSLASSSLSPSPSLSVSASPYNFIPPSKGFVVQMMSSLDGEAGWAALEKRFDELTATTNDLLPRARFWECIGMDKESKDFAGKLFDALARRRNITGDSIDKAQLKEFWDQMSDESFDSRLQTFFDMVDKDADGRITEEDEIISLSASANKLSNIQKQADECAALIMEELDPNNKGFILHHHSDSEILERSTNYRGQLNKRGSKKSARFNIPPDATSTSNNSNDMGDDAYVEITLEVCDDSVAVQSVKTVGGGDIEDPELALLARGLEKKSSMVRNASSNIRQFSQELKRLASFSQRPQMGKYDRTKSAAAHALKGLKFISKTDGAAGWAAVEKRFDEITATTNGLLPRARFCECIGMNKESKDFAGKLLDALARRRYITGDSIDKAQFKEFWDQMSDESFDSRLQIFFDMVDKDGDGPITEEEMREIISVSASVNKLSNIQEKADEYAALIMEELDPNNEGFILLENLEMLLLQAAGESVRGESRILSQMLSQKLKPTLDQDWYKKTTWMSSGVRTALYAGERAIRAFRPGEAVKILQVAVYPGNVLALHMSKPQGFNYESGQYMFVKCAAVSPSEWHPFFITSAPGDDYLSVHIQILGDWTRQLRTVFLEACQPPPTGESGLLRSDEYLQKGKKNNPILPRVLIDGPYGSPAQDYKKYDVVLLVGLGIGATPMISIVKDIMSNMKAIEPEELALENGSRKVSGSGSGGNFKTKRAYFYWVTKEQGSFEWFKGTMNEVAEMDEKGVIEMHNYCTSVYEEGDARSALITMLQSLNHAKNGVDIVSGTRVKSHFAKPNWLSVYERIALNHTNSRVGVFYCGPRALNEELRRLASDFSNKTPTKFDFHKENF